MINRIGALSHIVMRNDIFVDHTVTLRERDSMEQKRVKVEDLHRLIHDTVSINSLLRKLG